MNETITVIDPAHEFYGRVCVIMKSNEWYAHVRPLYHTREVILSPELFRRNNNV